MPKIKSSLYSLAALASAAIATSIPSDSQAMCGCMAWSGPPSPNESGALLNKASIVVMMRDGTHTVLTLSNDYFGPPEDFALLIPVPVVLRPEDVRTLDRGVFDRLQAVAAPHLVDLWEQDPCPSGFRMGAGMGMATADSVGSAGGGGQMAEAPPAVVVEAQFSEGEYDITILGATDSSALDQWLRDHQYRLPPGAEPVLRPYVAAGMKFFVARVDVGRLRVVAARQREQRVRAAQWMPTSLQEMLQGPPPADGEQVPAATELGRFLSPLRIHYETEQLSLPVRLGLLNSGGEQDLVVHILSPGTRYEVANYGNRTVPTDIHVRGPVARAFSRFYDSFFRRLSSRARRRVFTEYAGPIEASAIDSGCVGCSRPGLAAGDLDALGEELLPGRTGPGARLSQYVLTRLHYRYGARDLPDDLVFRPARPIAGGTGTATRHTSQRMHRAAANNYRVRFIAQHFYAGAVRCEHPQRGQWGGRPGSALDLGVGGAQETPWPANRPIPLTYWIRDAVPDLGLVPAEP